MKTLLLLLSSAYGWGDEMADLRSTYAKWAPRLHMQDWKVTLRVTGADELIYWCPSDCVAASKWKLADHTGTILVLCRKCYSAEQRAWVRGRGLSLRADQRDSVVHEMLHNVVENMNSEPLVVLLTRLLRP